MSDPTPLLVPMALQALLVNQDVQDGQEFHRWTPTYESLNEFADPIPAGFSESLTKPDQGVHLHWRLPSALTRARGKSTEKATFLFTPNRWIVVRLASTADATTPPKLVAWIVESDFMDP